MTPKSTNRLLALIAVLLAANLLNAIPVLPLAQAIGTTATHEILRARLIELVSQDGKVVAQLHTADDGAANLRMRDGNGEVRVKLGATTHGSGLILMNSKTEPALSLTASGVESSLTLAKPGYSPHIIRP